MTDDFKEDPEYVLYYTLDSWLYDAALIPDKWKELFADIETEIIYTGTSNAASTTVMDAKIRARDGTCRITRHGDACDNVHLVDKKFNYWYATNLIYENLNRRLELSEAVNDMRNGVLLTKELHWTMDHNIWTFAVKGGKLVAHFIDCTGDQGARFHNLELGQITNMKVGPFWTRFFLAFSAHLIKTPTLVPAAKLSFRRISASESTRSNTSTNSSKRKKFASSDLDSIEEANKDPLIPHVNRKSQEARLEDMKEEYIKSHPNVFTLGGSSIMDEPEPTYPDYQRFGPCCHKRCSNPGGRHFVQ